MMTTNHVRLQRSGGGVVADPWPAMEPGPDSDASLRTFAFAFAFALLAVPGSWLHCSPFTPFLSSMFASYNRRFTPHGWSSCSFPSQFLPPPPILKMKMGDDDECLPAVCCKRSRACDHSPHHRSLRTPALLLSTAVRRHTTSSKPLVVER